MRLDQLLDKAEWAFDGWAPQPVWRHVLEHVLGGAIWFSAGLVFLGLHGWKAGVFAGFCELVRQERCREAKPTDFPLWAIVADTGTATVTGLLLSLLRL